MVDCQTLQLILLDMLHTSDFRHFDAFRQDVASELLLNYLLNLFDPERSGVMKIKGVKLALAALSGATLSEKYQYFFKEMQTGHGYMSKEHLINLIQDLVQIPDLLRESVAFGKNVAAAVNSCVQVAGTLGDGVPEKGFYTWLMREPQTFIWLPTLHRLTAAETVKHECKCSVCKANPIVGFRYKCLQCLKFNMCQDCFFKGKVAKNHQLRHPMQEYCLPASAKDDTKAFVKIMRNKLGRKHRRGSKVTYLPVDGRGDQGLLEWEMRPIPPPPSPQQDLNAAAENAAEAGSRSGSLDSGNSSESGGDGASQHDPAPSSPSHGSCYDNSNSPARYLEERQPQKSGQMLQQEKHSLIHLVHRLRRENRLLRQQLRAGRCSPDDGDKWTSHATAEVTVELSAQSTGVSELTLTPNEHSVDITEATQTDDDVGASQTLDTADDDQSVLGRTISPIGEASTTVNTQRYTSDFFNSILSTTTNGTPSQGFSIQKTPRNPVVMRTPGTVLASTPADPRTPAPPTILKTGPRKPPRQDKPLSAPGSPGVTPVAKPRADTETTFQLDEAEGKVARAVARIESQRKLSLTASLEREAEDSDDDRFETVRRAGAKDYGQTPTSHIGAEKKQLGKSTGGQVAGRKMSAPLVSPTGDPHSSFSNTPDGRARRKSTGNLDDTVCATPRWFGLLGTPDSINFRGSLDALKSYDLGTPGSDRNTFAVSRGNSCLLTPERQEIDNMIKWIDAAFPSDLSYSALSLCHNEFSAQDQMLRAAESIGHAMADLVQATADNCYM
nr:hypothetical protein BaRGS_023465 [Batillaria attramentaria]